MEIENDTKKNNVDNNTKGFSRVIGFEEPKNTINVIIESLKDKDFCTKYNYKRSKGMILCSGSGFGKTYFTDSIKQEIKSINNVRFDDIPADVYIASVPGVIIRKLNEYFKEITKEKEIFHFLRCDEIEKLVPMRGSRIAGIVGSEKTGTILDILTGDEGVNTNYYIVGGTNKIGWIDEAAYENPLRLEKFIIPRPNLDERKKLAQIYLSDLNELIDSKIDIMVIVNYEGFTGGDFFRIRQYVLNYKLLNKKSIPLDKLMDYVGKLYFKYKSIPDEFK